MSKTATKKRPANWKVSTTFDAGRGRILRPGVEFRCMIDGYRGRMRFVEHVATPKGEWVTAVDKNGRWRSFHPDYIARVHTKTKGTDAERKAVRIRAARKAATRNWRMKVAGRRVSTWNDPRDAHVWATANGHEIERIWNANDDQDWVRAA